jgi:hypothetical protein
MILFKIGVISSSSVKQLEIFNKKREDRMTGHFKQRTERRELLFRQV